MYKYVENIRILAEFPVVYPEFSKEKKFLLTAEKVYQIFSKIDVKDYEILGFNGKSVKPHWMIIKYLPVPPNNLRPSNRSNAAARQEDENTKKLVGILHVCDILREAISDYESYKKSENKQSSKGEKLENDILMYTQMLQIHVSLYFDSKSVDRPQKFIKSNRNNKGAKGLFQCLSHKQGLFRGNLMGKRNDYTARTVISPDPYIGINEVVVPYSIAKNLTKCVYVNRFNIKDLGILML